MVWPQLGIPTKSGTAVNSATHGRTSELAPHQQLRPRHIYSLRNKTAECNFAVCREGPATPRQPQASALQASAGSRATSNRQLVRYSVHCVGPSLKQLDWGMGIFLTTGMVTIPFSKVL